MTDRICDWCNNEIFADGGGDDLILKNGKWYHKNFCVPPTPKPLVCAACKQDIPLNRHGETDNVLQILPLGGYGQFIDYLSRQDHDNYRFYLCHECAHEWCENTPWLKDIIRPYHSHAHTYEYQDAHPEHDGWDYNSRVRWALEAEALKACEFRGHDMDYFYPVDEKDIDSWTRSTCKKCGAEVDIHTKPMPNETDIAGPAVAINCRG